ncbi:MAG: hypothetical protein J7485_02520 [Sphingobium sp.]|nr:hypothetical protein [Sphingobium sp.]
MTKHLHPSRPAIAAIAAVLVLATAPAGAQPAPDVPSDPVVTQPETAPPAAEPTPAPEAAAPAAPAPVQIAPQSEVVQAVPAAQPETVAPASAPIRARTEPVRQAATTSAAAPSPRSEVLSGPVAAPAVAPDAQPATDLAQATPAVQPAATNDPDVTNAAWWALGGGTLLFVGGLGALALSRSRKRPESVRAAHTKNRAPAAARSTEPVTVQPAVAAEAAIAVPEPIIAPAAKTPARAAKATRSHWPELEEMVAEAPSPENPFLTRSKRMRRAKYLLEHGEPQPITQPAAKQAAKEVKQEEKPKAAAAKVVNGKSGATYSFGGKAKPRTNWKPATT